ncbi:AMIN domain-containing protein [Sulfurimonas sp.]|nr:AMIN domain-containing protein [Sulfurimonas sp.]
MLRFLLLSLLIFISLDARENPFFASIGEKDTPFTSNEIDIKTPLKRATISLPAQARLIQKVTIEFKNLDGSLESKSIDLDNSVDWHLPVFISQSYNNQEEKPQSKKISQRIKKDNYKEIASNKYIKLYSSGKKLKVLTKDSVIRNFLLVNPHRIVMDFKRESDMKSYTKNLSTYIFKKIRVGNHDGYYRTVIELDGIYRYATKKIDAGYLLELH